MPDIFATTPGGVYEFVVGGAALPFRISVGTGLTFAATKGVVTAVGIQQQSSYQFLHTLRNYVYVYVFGERIADLQVSGVMFLNPCDGGETGWKKVYDFYDANRLSNNPTPVNVTIGGVLFRSFLVGMSLQAQDPAAMVGQFALSFKYLPDQGA